MVTIEWRLLRDVAAVAGDRSEVAVPEPGLGLAEVVARAMAGHEASLGLVLDAAGDVRPDLVVLSNGRSFPRAGTALVRDGDVLVILPVVGGG